MKTKKTIKKTIEVQEISSISCNVCGKVVQGAASEYMSDITGVEIGFGYGSKFDTETWNFDICDACLEQFVSTFKIEVEKK